MKTLLALVAATSALTPAIASAQDMRAGVLSPRYLQRQQALRL